MSVHVMTMLFVLAIFSVFAYFAYDFWMRNNATEKTTPAKVISKTMDNKRNDSLYYIGFLFPDGTRKNVKVNVSQYNTIIEGEEGILTYKEYGHRAWFVGFKPNSNS